MCVSVCVWCLRSLGRLRYGSARRTRRPGRVTARPRWPRPARQPAGWRAPPPRGHLRCGAVLAAAILGAALPPSLRPAA